MCFLEKKKQAVKVNSESMDGKEKTCHHFKFQDFLILPFWILSVSCAEGWAVRPASDVTIHHTKAMSATDPLNRFVYSCIANTKIPTRAAYAIWPRGGLWVMSSRLIVINEPPHFLACLSINFWGGLARSPRLHSALDGLEIIAEQRVVHFHF